MIESSSGSAARVGAAQDGARGEKKGRQGQTFVHGAISKGFV
jgi:hypothetical protein